ncbi:MAG: DUF2851 family protein [Flavobacteriales bacterium]|nr:DUF2851 family protein [Flavobacteriales bacterium]
MPFPREELLHHIWKFRLFSSQELKTADGQTLEILRPGELNTDAGPDFLNARIKVDGVVWAGNVEMHIRASDWIRHQHQNDAAYNKLILHAAYENDMEQSVGDFPTIELKPFISDQVIRKYERLQTGNNPIPCGKQLMDVEPIILNTWFQSLLVQRLMRKSEWMKTLLEETNGDLEQAFLAVLFRAFGMKVNAEVFEQLAKATPWKILAKHQNDPLQLEAILFGNAGMLNEDPKDRHQQKLKREYDFLKHKYDLQPMDPVLWKFLRLRPANFPTVRIAQLASLFCSIGPFLKWFSIQNVANNLSVLKVAPSTYWKTHYQFGKESTSRSKRIGTTMVQNMLINAVAPFLFVTAERNAKEELKDRALELLENLPSEKNNRVRAFEELGLKVSDAATSQALLELRTNYCDHKKCLFCSIGVTILKRNT